MNDRSAAQQSETDKPERWVADGHLDKVVEEIFAAKDSGHLYGGWCLDLVREVKRLRAALLDAGAQPSHGDADHALAIIRDAMPELSATVAQETRETASQKVVCPKCGEPTIQWYEHTGKVGARASAKCWVGMMVDDDRPRCGWTGEIERVGYRKIVIVAGHRTGSEE